MKLFNKPQGGKKKVLPSFVWLMLKLIFALRDKGMNINLNRKEVDWK